MAEANLLIHMQGEPMEAWPVACEPHVRIAVIVSMQAGREPSGQVSTTLLPCPVCEYEQVHGVQVPLDIAPPGINQVQVRRQPTEPPR